MTQLQQIAIALIAIWLAAVAIWFRRSTVVLTGGLIAIGAFVLVSAIRGNVSISELGMSEPILSLRTIGFAAVWLALMLVYSPIADRLATRLIDKPPTLGAFRALQQSRVKLLIGIVAAWVLGGFLEEVVFRGIVLQSVEAALAGWLAQPTAAAAIAILTAALGAGVIHLYQGPRAAIIIVQLSILFGVLFVVSGYDLWAVILCHGLYDTIAFIRFAAGKSRYAKFAEKPKAEPVQVG
jgi:uncharacterized protein